MSTLVLVFIAIVPAVVLGLYVYSKDRVEKEPIGLLLKFFAFGALSCIPAAIVEGILNLVINLFFSEETIRIYEEKLTGQYNVSVYIYSMAACFIGIALVEEAGKFWVLDKISRKTPELNSLFDGLIYAVFVSLGFAALENILYVLENGLEVGIMRAVLSVPAHMFFGVIMGCSYSMWRIKLKASEFENILKAAGYIPPHASAFNCRKEKLMCILLPVMAHGFYDFCCLMGTVSAVLMLIVFVVFLYIYCFRKIRSMSRLDTYNYNYAMKLIDEKYPGGAQLVYTIMYQQNIYNYTENSCSNV